jgi:nitrogen fixation protein FixH
MAMTTEFTGKHMLIIMLSFFGVVIGVNLVMAWFANASWSGLIVSNGYVASQSFNSDLQHIRAQQSLGWAVSLSHDAAGLRFSVKDKRGNSVNGLSVAGSVQRTVTNRDDIKLDFAETAPGQYSAPAAMAPGLWEAVIQAQARDGTLYRHVERFTARGS